MISTSSLRDFARWSHSGVCNTPQAIRVCCRTCEILAVATGLVVGDQLCIDNWLCTASELVVWKSHSARHHKDIDRSIDCRDNWNTLFCGVRWGGVGWGGGGGVNSFS